ncbi:HTH_Tnp_Tc3_2 domain-containing protein [Trichonephila clavipes]|nr:HTH_Tnp_Tc3_2 domain-containing protein [Trichonephila clavipes]
MGHSISETVRQLQFSKSTMSRVYPKYKDDGQKTSDRANCKGRHTLSKWTVQRWLHRMGFGSRLSMRVPRLNARHWAARLAWAKENRDWNVEGWKRVAWSDESRFHLLNCDGRLRI